MWCRRGLLRIPRTARSRNVSVVELEHIYRKYQTSSPSLVCAFYKSLATAYAAKLTIAGLFDLEDEFRSSNEIAENLAVSMNIALHPA